MMFIEKLKKAFRIGLYIAMGGIIVCQMNSAFAGELPLTLDFNGVSLGKPYPVTGGVPMRRGELKNINSIRLSEDGKDIPVQTEALAFWPDKSIKWVLLDFQTEPTQKQKTLILHYGSDVKPTKMDENMPHVLTKSDKYATTIDTGVLKFCVNACGGGFIDELTYRGQSVFKTAGRRVNIMDAIHVESPSDYHPMDRYIKNGKPDPSTVRVTGVRLETAGPLRATVLIDGVYSYKFMGSTIQGTSTKGDCPFRIRIHAYAGQSMLKIEHFFYYEGDGDHDFVRQLALRVPLPKGDTTLRYINGDGIENSSMPITGLFQQSADNYLIWQSEGQSAGVTRRGSRFEGVLDSTTGAVSTAIGIRDFWQNGAKGLSADLKKGELSLAFWPAEAAPLDFRRHARQWSVGECGTPDDPRGTEARDIQQPNYRLASKGVGKTHYAMLYYHDPAEKTEKVLNVYKLFNQRPLLWAPSSHYADSFVLGRYRERVPGEYEEIENILDSAVDFWKFAQDYFRWYGFWIYGNVCQNINMFRQNGRCEREFGRWGWANGDCVGRLAYALMLQAVRKGKRKDLEFAEKYLYNIHDVCSTHTPSYPHHYTDTFRYIKGAAHRHGAWPWAGPYVGIRGAHPVGAKIYYFLTGEGHAKDILDEITELVLRNPNGGEGDGNLGPNAQIFLYQWEVTGDPKWKELLKAEIDNSNLLRTAESGWLVMMASAFGISNALEEYMELSGDGANKGLLADFADRAMPEKMKRHWTWAGYFRVYSGAYNVSKDQKYNAANEEMLKKLVDSAKGSMTAKVPLEQWPGLPGYPKVFADANVIRDVPFAIFSLQQGKNDDGKKNNDDEKKKDK